MTPAEVMANQPMQDLLWRVCFRWKLRPRQVTGDNTTYGTVETIVAVEDERIRAYMPLADFDHRTPFFGRDAFAYDADVDAYTCPGDADASARTSTPSGSGSTRRRFPGLRNGLRSARQ